MSNDDKHIREFAYQIWESEGRPEGQEARHWEMAHKLAQAQALAPPRQPPRPPRPRPQQNLLGRKSPGHRASLPRLESTFPLVGAPARDCLNPANGLNRRSAIASPPPQATYTQKSGCAGAGHE